ILAGTMPASSLNVENPTPVELAEQMLCGAGSSDPEIVRMCLPHMLRAPDDPWWNDALMHATLPESFQLILNHGIHPDVRGESGFTILHHLATPDAGRRGSFMPTDQQRLLRAKMLLDAGASLTVR